jgi:hypothetical protein
VALKFQLLSNLGPKPEEAKPKPLEDIIPRRPAWLSWLPLDRGKGWLVAFG